MNNKKRIFRPLIYKVNVNWTSSEEVILNFLNSYQNKTFILTQKQLSIQTNTSEATISRFCKKAGSKTYKSFVFYFNQILLEFNREYPIDEPTTKYTINNLLSKNIFAIKNTLNDITVKQIERASDMILSNKRIVIFGKRFSEGIASELAINLLKVGLNVLWNNDFYKMMAIVCADKNDNLYIFFSNKSEEKEISFLLEEIKKNKSKIILITSNNEKLIKRAVDIKIEYKQIQDEEELISIGSKISQSIIADTIFETILNKKPVFKMKLLKLNATWKRWNNQ